MFSGKCAAIIHLTLNDLETSVKVPIDFSYTTLCGLSVVTFALYSIDTDTWHLTISTMALGAAGTSVVVGFELSVMAVSVASTLQGSNSSC